MAPAEKRRLVSEAAPVCSATFLVPVVACRRRPGVVSPGLLPLSVIPGTLEATLALRLPPVAC